MPNFDPDHCLEHSIDNEKQNLSWINRDDTHCFHNFKCCWCGRKNEEQSTSGRHGKHAPKPRKRARKADDAPAPIEAEPVDGSAARMPKPPEPAYYCEECKAPMVLRKNRKTRRLFFGCSNYPQCDFILNSDGTKSQRGDFYGEHDYESEMEYWDPNFDL